MATIANYTYTFGSTPANINLNQITATVNTTIASSTQTVASMDFDGNVTLFMVFSAPILATFGPTINTNITALTYLDNPLAYLTSTSTVFGTTATLQINQTANRTITMPDATTTMVGTDVAQTLTNKSLVDASTFIVNSADMTKRMQFSAASIPTGTTVVFTIPNGNGILPILLNATSLGAGDATYPTVTGTNDSFYGVNAGGLITSGSDNTGMGFSALHALLTGSNNTGIGNQALQFNTASNNTALGSLALASNIAATPNTAVGYQALMSNISGTNNVGVGDLALTLATGNDNTGLGSGVLSALTTGTDNTALGKGADSNLTTGTFNIVLGSGAQSGSVSATNRIVLGSGGSGLADNALTVAGTAAITGFYFPGLASSIGTNVLFYNTSTKQITQQTPQFADGSFTVYNSGTNSKVFALNVSNVSTSTTRTFTVPNNNGILPATLNATSFGAGNAIYATNTGTNDSYFGIGSGVANTSGSGNSGFGFNTLNALTTASNNTAMGSTALAVNTAASNSAFGSGALALNTSGTPNSAFGINSLATNVAGTNNVAMGDAALNLATSSNNTGVGSGALSTVAGGASNTALGQSAGNTITTGGSNVILGANAQASGAAASNQVVLGAGGLGLANSAVTIASAITDFYFPSLTSATNTNILYYNPTNKNITQGVLTSTPSNVYFSRFTGTFTNNSNAAYAFPTGTGSSLTIPSFVAGATYVIFYSWVWGYSVTTRAFLAQLYANSVAQLSQTTITNSASATNLESFAGQVTVTNSGATIPSYPITVGIKATNNGDTATITNINLFAWRVA